MSQLNPDLRAELAARNAEHETEYYLQFSEDQLIDLASGFVPTAVIAKARFALDTIDADQRKAASRAEADALKTRRGLR